jgi:hypothetical protein
MKTRRGIALGSVIGALGIIAGAAAAFSAIPIPDAKGVIRACVKYEDIDHYEQMRWSTKTTCPKSEKLISWNYKGRTGAKGATGATGPAGAKGDPGTSQAYVASAGTTEIGSNNTEKTIVTRPNLPAGNYVFNVSLKAVNYHGFKDSLVRCYLRVAGQAAPVTATGQDLRVGATETTEGSLAMTAAVPSGFFNGGDVTVSCQTFLTSDKVRIENAQLTAIVVDNIS